MNNFAITSGGIGDALLRSAAAMNAANNTLDETIALITAANTIVQNPDVVGTTMKTVSMYLRAAKTEAEEAGESTEGMANSVSELRDEIMQLTGNKVDILESDGSFKSTYDILKALSEVWDQLSDTSQANVLEMIGGKRNANVVSALLENFTVAEKTLKVSAESAGSALKENEIYLDSISGRIQAFSASFQSLSNSLIDSSLVKGVVSIGTGIVNILNHMAKVQMLLPTIISLFFTVKGALKAYQTDRSAAVAYSLFDEDKKDVEQLLTRIKALTAAERELYLQRSGFKSFEAFGESVLSEHKEYSKGSEEYNRMIEQYKALGSVTDSVTGSADRLNTSLGGVWKTMSGFSKFSLVATGVTTAFSIIVGIYKAWKQAQEEARQAAADAAIAYNDTAKSLEEYKLRAEELRKAIDGGNLSEEEAYNKRVELIEIQKQLVDLFGDEAAGINLVTGEIKEQIKAIDALSESEYDTWYATYEDIIQKSVDKIVAPNLFSGNEIVIPDGLKTVDGESISLKAIEELAKDINFDVSNNHIKIKAEGKSVYELIDLYTQLSTSIQAAAKEIDELTGIDGYGDFYTESISSTISKRLEELQGYEKDNVENFNTYVEGQLNYNTAYSEIWSKALAAQQEYEEAVAKGDSSAAQTAYKAMKDAETAFLSEGWNDAAVNLYIEQFFDKFRTQAAKEELEIKIETFINNRDPKGLIQEAIEFFEDSEGNIDLSRIIDAQADYNAALGSGSEITEESLLAYAKLFALMRYTGAKSIEELIIGFVNLGRTQQKVIETTPETNSQTLKEYKEQVDIFRKVISEFERTGTVSSDTYNRLIESGEDYADIVEYSGGKIVVNTDKLEEHRQALMGDYSAKLLAAGATKEQIAWLEEYSASLSNSKADISEARDELSGLTDLFKKQKDGDTYGALEIWELIEEYPELRDHIIETAEGYKIEEEAIRDLIKARIALLRTDLKIKSAAANSKTHSVANDIISDYNVQSWEEYKRAWEGYFGKAHGSADLTNFFEGYQEYVESVIALNKLEPEILKELDSYTGEDSETWFDRRLREHQHNVAMEKETTEEYLKWLESANEQAYSEEIIDKDTYYSNLEELYDGSKELFQDYLSDTEHQIEMLNNQGADSSSIIPMYQEMMAAVEGEIDKYHAAGLTDNDAYIQKMKSQWWTYRDELLDVYGEALDANITDYEHDIFMLEQHEGSADEIIAIYRKMQEEVHATANDYRALGLAEDDDLIQELQQKWWEYQENIVEARREAFNNDIDIKKFGIETLKQEGGSSTEIIDSWKSILSDINAEIAYYSEAGYSSSHEIMRELTEQAWETKEELVNAIKAVVEEINSAVDGFQNVYSTLTDAAKEYASTGYLSVDSLQAILELEPKYLAYLTDENGQLVINEQALQNVIAAKTEELAAETALAYAKQVLLAVEQNDIATLTSLTQATAASSGATWDMAYATIGLAKAMGVASGMEASYFDDAVSYINKMQSLSQTAASTVSAYYQTLDEGYVSQKDGLDKILQATQDMIKWEQDQMIEALEKEKDLYNDLIDQKKEMIELTKEEHDHERDTADKLEEIARLQSKIDQLSLDDSREAQAQKRQLEEELNELQKGFADDQADYAYDVQIDALDREKEAYNEAKDDEIEGLRNMLDSAEELYQAAIARINGGWDTLYNDLISWNAEYGSMLESELVSAWDAATAAVQRYGSFVDALEGVDSYTNLGSSSVTNSDGSVTEYGGVSIANPGDIIGSMKANSLEWYIADDQGRNRLYAEQQALADQWESTFGEKLTNKNGVWYRPNGDVLYSLTEDEVGKTIVDEMKRNGEAWNATENESERRALEARNEELAATLSSYLGEEITRGADGVWYLRGKKLFDAYHSGGIVGRRPTLEQNEMMAVLEEGEAVLDEKKERSLYKIIDFVDYLSEKIGSAIDIDKLMDIFPNRIELPKMSSLIPEVGRTNFNIEINPSVEINITHGGSMTEEDAKRYGEIASDNTIRKIKEAFAQRGISNIGNAILKQ